MQRRSVLEEKSVQCCTKISVESNGETKRNKLSALGAFIRNQESGDYVKVKTDDNGDQYYMTKDDNDGWKVIQF